MLRLAVFFVFVFCFFWERGGVVREKRKGKIERNFAVRNIDRRTEMII